MRKLLLILLLITIFLVLAIGVNAEKYMWQAGTTAEGTNWYVIIGVLSEAVNNYAGDYVYMTPIGYTKSTVGLKGFDQHGVVSMYSAGIQFVDLIRKEGVFSPELYKWSRPFNQMLWVYDLDFFFLIRREDADKIKSWSDLANKRVWARARGTTSFEAIKSALGPNGLNIWDTINIKAFERSHAADALKLKEVDAILAMGPPGGLISYAEEAISRTDCVVLGPTPEELEKILNNNEFFSSATRDSEAFGDRDVGLTKPIQTTAISQIIIVSPDVPEESVYQVVKVVSEHATEMAQTTALWGKFAKDSWEYDLPLLAKYKKMGVPIHPGTLRYLRELGYDTKLLGLE